MALLYWECRQGYYSKPFCHLLLSVMDLHSTVACLHNRQRYRFGRAADIVKSYVQLVTCVTMNINFLNTNMEGTI